MNTRILIVHATKLTERAKRMSEQLDRLCAHNINGKGDLSYQFIREGDKEMLTDDILDKWFAKGSTMYGKHGGTSCAMKHILACQYIIDNNLPEALIMEDDIELHANFIEKFEQSMEEYRRKYADIPVMISYEDSTLQFIPRSQRKPGVMLYNADKGRYTGIYLINNHGAKAVLEAARNEKIHLPIDGYHTYLIGRGKLKCLWSQPAIATQGSFTGLYSSAIKQRRHGFIKLRWLFKLYYKKLLYNLR